MSYVVLIVLFIFLWPFWLIWRIMRRRVLAAPAVLFVALSITFGTGNALALMSYLLVALVIWRYAHQESYNDYFWRFFRSSWRRWRVYDKHWKKVMRRLYLTDHQHMRTIYPKVIKVRCNKIQDRVLVDFLRSQDPDDFRTYSTNLAHAFGAQMCYVRDDESGRCWLEFPRGKTLQEEVSALPIPDVPDLNNVEIGIYEDGSPMSIGLRGTHYYVAGSTGSGKGSVIDSIIRNLASGIRDGWISLVLCDPKGGMQLRCYEPMAKAYASRYEKMAAIIHQCALDMQARSEELSAKKIRLHKPSVKYPQVLLIIDEMAALTLYLKETNLKLSKQLIGDLGLILTEGRAIGYSVIACAQDPRKEVNSLRSLFPGKLGLQFDEEGDVDTAMGKGAVNKGALCHMIPKNPKRYEDWAGIGYELYEGGTAARKFRTAHPTDAHIDFMVLEYAIKKAIEEHADDGDPDGERPRSAA